jgi:hypothetical protein
MEKYSIQIPDQTENSLVVSTLVDQLKMEINNVNSVIESMNKLPALKASYLERVNELIAGLAVMSVQVELLDKPVEVVIPVIEPEVVGVVIAAEPEIVIEPEVSVEPEIVVQEPEIIVEPEIVVEPEVSAEPEVIVEPETTEVLT